MKRNIIYILIISFLVLLQINTCKRGSNATQTITSDTVYIYDTVQNDTTIIRDNLIFIRDTVPIYDSVIDTLYIVEDYYTPRYYRDTIIDTLSVFAEVIDTVHKNMITGRSINYSLTTITETREITNTIRETNYFSIGLQYNMSIYPVIGYNYNRINYTIGYDISEKSVNFGILYNFR